MERRKKSQENHIASDRREHIMAKLQEMREYGMSYQSIADTLALKADMPISKGLLYGYFTGTVWSSEPIEKAFGYPKFVTVPEDMVRVRKPSSSKPRVRLAIDVSEDLRDWFNSEAKRLECTRAQFLEKLLNDYALKAFTEEVNEHTV